MKRREFIKYSVILLGATAFATESGFYALHVKSSGIKILQEPYQTISIVLDNLFLPHILMPSPHAFNTIGFLQAVMKDKRVSDEIKKTINDGVKWLNQSAKNSYYKSYQELSFSQREKILREISNKQWGDTWLWHLMNFTFEAMFSDPVYGANINQVGWKWLEYESGFPPPLKVNIYV